jgi:hypothetical protein
LRCLLVVAVLLFSLDLRFIVDYRLFLGLPLLFPSPLFLIIIFECRFDVFRVRWRKKCP